MHHIAVLDDVFLAFGSHLASHLGRSLSAQSDKVVIGYGLGADEALLEVGVDYARSLGGCITNVNGPGPGLLGPHREIGL